MVEFLFVDNNGAGICNIDASDELPDEVAGISIRGQFDSNTSSCKLLISMLKNSPKRFQHITLDELSSTEHSPAFLAFLVLICNRTKALHLSDCRLSTSATSCLMASLFTHDGIRHFSFSMTPGSAMNASHAKILFEGVACSPCLESLNFRVLQFVGEDEDVGTHLIEALRQNQSLKDICVSTNSFYEEDFRNVIKASILGPKVKAVKIMDYKRPLLLDVLQDVLSRKDCTLEKLHLFGISILTENGWNGSIIQNVSVKSLTISGTSDWDELSNLVGLFKSLEELDLSDNCITRLSFLDRLLFGESSQLKSLNVSCNRIDKEEMKLFIEKLGKLRGLKRLEVGGNLWEGSLSTHSMLVDALRDNTDLEYLDYGSWRLPFDLNRGGRRVFESSQPFPTNLLPLVLERASKISYYGNWDSWGDPTEEYPRADVVFWMIHRITPQL